MSNYIQIQDTFIHISGEDIDGDQVMALSNKGRQDSKDNRESIAGWYLTDHTYWEDDTLSIPTNGAYSSHTWRSFKAMMLTCVKPFMLPNRPDVRVSLTISDESDGFAMPSHGYFNLTKGCWDFEEVATP